MGKESGEHSRNQCHLETSALELMKLFKVASGSGHLCQAHSTQATIKCKTNLFVARAGQAPFWRNILETTATWRCRGGQVPFWWGMPLGNILETTATGRTSSLELTETVQCGFLWCSTAPRTTIKRKTKLGDPFLGIDETIQGGFL